MRQKNPKKRVVRRLTVTYEPHELDTVKIQHASFRIGSGTMSKLVIKLIQRFMKKYEAGEYENKKF
jgi:hypothetical protein